MGRFLEETIESVLSQDYPRIEYIVRDGGSTDSTLALLARYQGRLRYYSGPDDGTADALNQGFRDARGTILAYLNADDVYLPGAVSSAVCALGQHPTAAVVYGEGDWIDEQGDRLGRYPTQEFEPARFQTECFLCQPATFFRRSAYEAVGGINTTLQYTFDYDLWIRLARSYQFVHIDDLMALSRMHRANKSLGQRKRVYAETFAILQQHFGYVPFAWIYSDTCYRADGRDQFFEPLQPSVSNYIRSLGRGLQLNWRHPLRYTQDWAKEMSWEGLKRRLQTG